MNFLKYLCEAMFPGKARKRQEFFTACGVDQARQALFPNGSADVVPVRFTSDDGKAFDLYLLNPPSRWPEEGLWIVGGDLEDDMLSLCCDPKSGAVSLVRSFISVDEIEADVISSSVNRFLECCEEIK